MSTPDEVRQWALALPAVSEVETWGHPTFRVRDKIFATLSADGHHAGVKASLEQQEQLITMAPATFASAEYTGRFGWVTVDLAFADPALLCDLIRSAWRRTAPKRLVTAYEAERLAENSQLMD